MYFTVIATFRLLLSRIYGKNIFPSASMRAAFGSKKPKLKFPLKMR
jgi:hypothetical protein